MKRIIILLVLLFSFVEANAEEKRIAVLPFKNLMQKQDFNYLSEGIAATITAKLGSIRGIAVVERSQLEAAFKEMGLQKAGVVDEKTAVKAGKILGVDIVVIGEFQVAGDQVRISARFVEVQTGKVVSTAVETDFFQKIFMLQDAVAFSLAESLQKALKIVATGAESEDVKKEKATMASMPPGTASEYYSKGYDYKWNKKDTDKAVEYYLKAVSIDPNHENALFELGYVYNEKGEYQKAIGYYSKVVALNPRAKDAFNNIGLAYSRLNDQQNAEKWYKKSLDIDPNYAIALNGLGLVMWKTKKFKEAEVLYKKAIQSDPKYHMAYYNMGILYEDMKQYAESKDYYRKTIEINPGYVNAMINLGIILETKDKNFSDAEYWYKKASEASPDNHLAYYNLGFLYSNKEFSKYDIDKAIGYYQKVTTLKPDHDLSYFYMGNLFYNDKKEYPKAIAAYEKAIQLYGKDPAYYNNLGLVYEAQKEYAKAEGYYRKSIEIDPSYGIAWESLGYALYYQYKDDETKEAWKKAVSLGKTSAKDALKKYYNISDVPPESTAPLATNLSASEYYSKGYDYKLNKKDTDKAIEYYLKAVSIDPNHTNALFELGYVYNEKGEYSKAIEYYNRVLAIDPRAKDALNNIGLSYESQKDYVKAESYYRKAIEVDPSYGIAWESLGYALYFQHKDNEAIEAWKKASSLGKTGAKDALKKYFNITD
ncbi:MAG: FlgO family outer membrane protein [Nitrospirae bacterium]|nr:FlgO family outer membrane protein [Nitrospirota bacterium]